ncbi:hypothetical protein BXZ70DRAFT_1006967 [Cristinia sonorae]|uniref:Uncharacterized protein n=1 Tax=Cristinia sonorae TaxID=1940300 RepID=A0A8K0XQQ9_9AGAR|nr:hypothetical protein BXZ70DRAFT_1006967 [Cristinia sonorae]
MVFTFLRILTAALVVLPALVSAAPLPIPQAVDDVAGTLGTPGTSLGPIIPGTIVSPVVPGTGVSPAPGDWNHEPALSRTLS